uniref:MHD1 domain-containing protein n=1 Tax=Glycine max TaxID=3847 RepID=A0A0R0L463_SOYBN
MDQAGLVRFPSFSFFISFTFQFLPTLQGSKPPLDVADKLTDPFPPSPLFSTANTLNSPLLPPFKFHPALLQPRNLAFATGGYGAGPDDSYESMDDANFSDEELSAPNNLDFSDSPTPHNYDEEQLFPCKGRREILKTGLADQSLTIQVPNTVRRFTDGEMGFNKCLQRNLTPAGTAGVQLQKQFHLRNDTLGLGTPSAPPIIDSEFPLERDSECSIRNEPTDPGSWPSRESLDFNDGTKSETSIEQKPKAKTVAEPTVTELAERLDKTFTDDIERHTPHLQYYNTSCNSQFAWQTLITYDACIRLCLQAWAKGCTEAPEFLKDECLALRSAFGLHEFLLQPRGVKPTEGRNNRNSEQTLPLKTKKVVGKIRVEVKKLRIIPRQKLKITKSQRGSIYMKAGVEYVRHVSSLVKNGINSMKAASFSLAAEEPLHCLIQLKSTTEENESEPCSAILLRPGSGDYHDFFPLSQGDALIVEVQDSKKVVHGEARIPMSSLSDNPSDRIRWWPVYHDERECVGKIQLSIGSTMTSDENNHIKSAAVVETQAYDLLLEGAMRAQNFHSRNLRLNGPWKWLLDAFADYYGVSNSYARLRYLLHVMNVATPTKDCLGLVRELLEPLIKARSERSLTRQEVRFDSAAPALDPAVQVYTSLHDILSLDAQTILRNYLQTAARKRCRKHMMETDEFVSSTSEGYLMDTITISTAYLKMKNLCVSIRNEIQADIKIHNQHTIHGQHIFPSSIDLTNITAAVYSTELGKRLRAFLSALPPSSPQAHVNELLVATADFERDLESWNISLVQGGVDSRNLFHNYIMVWIQDMQLSLLDLCKAEKVPWAGVTTNHSTSPFAEEMYEKIKDNLTLYEVVINRWPQYSLYLENAVANIERAIVKSLEKQYSDILTPLKDSIQKRLHLQVQKIARRQSATVHLVPNQLGIFLNTIKRILDVLHCRVEDILNSWASCLPVIGDKKTLFGEQMNGITVLLRTKYKTYLQAIIGNLVNSIQANRNTRLKKILEETTETDGEAEVRERMQLLNSQLTDFISNLHEVFTSQIFIAICRGLWDRMGQIILKFLEGRKENRIWYNGSSYALGILDDTFASQMQRLRGNSLQEKDIEPPRSVIEARSILCKDTANATDTSNYLYI